MSTIHEVSVQFQANVERLLISNPEEAAHLLDIEIEKAKANNDHLAEARCYLFYSQIPFFQGLYQEALDYIDQAGDVLKSKEEDLWGTYYAHKGVIYKQQKKYELAIRHYYRALEYKNDLRQAKVYNNLASIFLEEKLADPDKAINYANKSLELFDKLLEKPNTVYSVYSNLGAAYTLKKDFGQALIHFDKGLKVASLQENPHGHAMIHLNIGDTHAHAGNLQEAALHYTQGIEIVQRFKNTRVNIYLLLGLGHCYRRQKKHKKAIEIYAQALEIAEKNQAEFLSSECLKYLYITERDIGNFEKALKFHERHIHLKDDINHKQLNELISFHDLELEELRQKNLTIVQQNKELALKNQKLSEFNYIVAHDLKEPLRSISSFTSLIQRRYPRLVNNEGKDYFDYIANGAREMYDKLDGLLVYISFDKSHLKFKPIDLGVMVQTIWVKMQEKFSVEGIKLSFGNLPIAIADEFYLTTVFEHLFQNAIQFSSERPLRISVSCQKGPDHYQIAVKDNGQGIYEGCQSKVFRIFYRSHKNKGTGRGLGLAFCKKIIELHGGKIWVESEEGYGSMFYFTLPCEKN